MTIEEEKREHRHEYSMRLGAMGLEPADNPSALQHNTAVDAADAHVAAIKAQERQDALAGLLALKESL